MRQSTAWLLAAALYAPLLPAIAQQFPTRPIRIVAPDTPGGNFDLSARAVGASIAEQLKQPVIVDNRPGGSTTIGAGFAAKSPADGYTLLYTGAMHATVRQFIDGVSYDPLADFTPVAIMATTPVVIAVRADAQFQSIGDLVRMAKEKPNAYTIGTLGPGSSSEIAAQDLMDRLGVRLRTIPYKGAPGAVNGILSGEIDTAILSPLTSKSLVDSGKMRALAISSGRRLDNMSAVPTLSETVAPGYTFEVWFALLAPKDVPQPVLQRLHDAVQVYQSQPETKTYLDRMGLQPVSIDLQATRDYFLRDSRRLVEVARKMASTK